MLVGGGCYGEKGVGVRRRVVRLWGRSGRGRFWASRDLREAREGSCGYLREESFR